MKLACTRCKRKKIKCGRNEPICQQCIAANAECQYVERRPRPRGLGKHRNAIEHLQQRLELLEKQTSSTSDEDTPSVSTSEPRPGTAQSNALPPWPETSSGVDDGQESWVYRLASATRRHFQTQATPAATPGQTPRSDQARDRIDSSLVLLNEALDDLGNLRLRTEAHNVVLDLSPTEARAYIDSFGNLKDAMAVPGVFAFSTIDIKFLRALPEMIDSPHIVVKSGTRVMYYNALYYGLLEELGPGHSLTTKAYMKVLESVPAWLEDTDMTDLDGNTAALTAWTAINNHDYQLAWKFHCKSIFYLRARGIDQLDVTPTRSFEEEAERVAHRYLYWHILSIDMMFQLFFGKPAMMRWSPNNVRPPDFYRDTDASAAKITTTIVWIRITRLATETLNLASNTKDNIEGVALEVDKLCLQLEGIMAEWKLERLMDDEDISNDYRCLIIDAVMTIYAIIIGMQRLVQKTRPGARTLHAARRIVTLIIEFYASPTLTNRSRTVCTHFMTFFPFCAIFTLYEHIIACLEPEECDSDIQALENMGLAMAQISTERPGFVPFAKTIDALNKVSRILLEERRLARTTDVVRQVDSGAMEGVDLPWAGFDAFQNLVATELLWFSKYLEPPGSG
ncbi:Fungal-trans domain-containing protein [Pyrenophora tritici-repentis]|nr:Fungal-trans domain-containing protein [Pyrenophora tritici-repentis]KAI0618297.1 Fungal-trans domain-containing protein [Pyrenophora tritici-repentis]